MVHHLAGARLHRAHAPGRAPRRVCLRALRLPRQADPAGRGHRPLRAADRRRRYGLPGARRPWWVAGRVVGRTAGHHGVGDPARARVLQLRGRRTDRRRTMGPAGSASGGGRADAGRVPAQGLADGHAPRTRARRGRRRPHGVPLHLHLLRRGADPRRADLLDPRSGDLPADLRDLRPVHGRGADADPVRRGGRCSRPARVDRTAPGDRTAARGRVRHRPAATRGGGVGAAGRGRGRRRRTPGAAARGAGAAVARRRRLRLLPGADPQRRGSSSSRRSRRSGTRWSTPSRPPPSRW